MYSVAVVIKLSTCGIKKFEFFINYKLLLKKLNLKKIKFKQTPGYFYL